MTFNSIFFYDNQITKLLQKIVEIIQFDFIYSEKSLLKYICFICFVCSNFFFLTQVCITKCSIGGDANISNELQFNEWMETREKKWMREDKRNT